MLPPDVVALGDKDNSDPSGRNRRACFDKATKTGLGRELLALRKAYDGAEKTLNKIDVGMLGKLRDENAIDGERKS